MLLPVLRSENICEHLCDKYVCGVGGGRRTGRMRALRRLKAFAAVIGEHETEHGDYRVV
jgi:hypothetical protein